MAMTARKAPRTALGSLSLALVLSAAAFARDTVVAITPDQWPVFRCSLRQKRAGVVTQSCEQSGSEFEYGRWTSNHPNRWLLG